MDGAPSGLVPVLRTRRLLLRGFREEDLDALAAMEADPEVMRHLGLGEGARRPRGRIETWRHMAELMGQWALRGCGLWAVEHDGRCVGRVGILHPEGWPGPELAYALAREAWGQGLAAEAARAALAWAEAHLPGRGIISLIHPENEASRRVARSLGGLCTGRVLVLGVEAERWEYPRLP
ncbi:MAG: GNAT family N-acetyltransferase [Roseococcus sp.]|nr:GNAT family N-acetyltransferase [Roseococcus sp.]